MNVNEELVRKALGLIDVDFSHMGFKVTNLEDAADLLKQALAPDTPKFYVGQPVLVKNYDGSWKKYSILDMALCRGRKCIPDVDALSQPNWIEHDGSEKLIEIDPGNIFIACDKTGWPFMQEVIVNANSFGDLNEHVLRYCVIPLPEFME